MPRVTGAVKTNGGAAAVGLSPEKQNHKNSIKSASGHPWDKIERTTHMEDKGLVTSGSNV